MSPPLNSRGQSDITVRVRLSERCETQGRPTRQYIALARTAGDPEARFCMQIGEDGVQGLLEAHIAICFDLPLLALLALLNA
jgi:hypothetical protein